MTSSGHLGVLDPEGACLVHEAAAPIRRILHLLGAQAVALGFDHGVLAADEVEETLLIRATVSPEYTTLSTSRSSGRQGVGR
jgi:hypothetical protein